MYVITGATGKTGGAIALGLLEAGKQVRVLGRNADKLQELTAKGAEALTGDLYDVDFLTRAFAGAQAVYAMVPPGYEAESVRAHQNAVADVLVEAVQRAGVPYVVTLSSIGADLPEKTGVVLGLHDMETKFNALEGVNVLHLRPGYFMENILGQAGVIKQTGAMASSLRGDVKIAAVATRDIAEKAVQHLLALDFRGTGNVAYVLGQRDVTYNEIAALFGRAIGIDDLKYVYLEGEQAWQALVYGWGITAGAAEALMEFTDTVNKGEVFATVQRTPDNTTRTSIEQFADTFRHVYENS